jgi:O-antigen ligase
MRVLPNTIWLYAFGALMISGAAAFGYFHVLWLVLIPVAVVGIIFLLQHPQLLLYVLLASIPWSVEYNFTQSLGTDLPDEPLMLLTAFAFCIAAAFKWRQFSPRKVHPLVWLLIIQFCWIFLTALASSYLLVSLKYVLAKSWYLLAFVALPRKLFSDRRVIARAAAVLLFSMMALMFVTLVRHEQYNWTFEKINNALKPFFRNHVNYSALLVFMVPLQVAFLQGSKSAAVRWMLRLLLIITIVALYFSYARGAWLALLAGWASYFLIRKRWLVKTYVLSLALFILGILWLKAGDRYLAFSHDYKTTIFHTNFSEHLVATYQLKDVSTAERYYRWIAGVRMIKDSWQTGFGPSTFYDNYKSYTVPAFKTWVSKNEEHSTVHNYFLLLIIEQGVIGLLLFLFLVGWLFHYCMKIYHRTTDIFWKYTVAAISSILVMICTVNFLSDLIETDKIGSVFYLCIAALIVADVQTRPIQKAEI